MDENKGKDRPLSQVSRRAFLKTTGVAVVGLVAAGTVGCRYSDYSDNCGYCNGSSRNYYHCDGDYCNYLNYSDS